MMDLTIVCYGMWVRTATSGDPLPEPVLLGSVLLGTHSGNGTSGADTFDMDLHVEYVDINWSNLQMGRYVDVWNPHE